MKRHKYILFFIVSLLFLYNCTDKVEKTIKKAKPIFFIIENPKNYWDITSLKIFYDIKKSDKLFFAKENVVYHNFRKLKKDEYLQYFKNYLDKENQVKLSYINEQFYPKFWVYNDSWKICNYSDSLDIMLCNHEGDISTNIFFINKYKDTSLVNSNFATENIELFSYKNIINIILYTSDYMRIIFYDTNKMNFKNKNTIEVNTECNIIADTAKYKCYFYPFIEKKELIFKFIVNTFFIKNDTIITDTYKFNISKQDTFIFDNDKIFDTQYEIFYSEFLYNYK